MAAIDATCKCDVLVVGSGAGGMATALTARLHGLDVLVVEKEDFLGGGTAFSYGTLWVPCNPVAARLGIGDSTEQALEYLRREIGPRFNLERVSAYLHHAPRMIEFFEQKTKVRFVCREDYPDYHASYPGAVAGGRTLFAAPYDGRSLGPDIDKLRPPLPTQTIMGMMYTPKEVKTFQTWISSWKSFAYVGRRILRHWADLLRYGRTMWLTNGNALAARLLKTARDLNIPVWESSPLQELCMEGGRVCGALVKRESGTVRIEARLGVVLATGGFGQDKELCRSLFSHAELHGESWSLAPPGNTGDGLKAGERAGGEIDRMMKNAGFWAPVSRAITMDNALAGHYHDRQRPGFIAVNRDGRRFANESASYHHFGEAIIRDAGPGKEPMAYLISDHRSIRRTGCGTAIFPAPFSLKPHLRAGYLISAPTLEELAGKIGVPAATLRETVDEFNHDAKTGTDRRFGRGDTVFDRYFGSPRQKPNPCLGPLENAPYYAVRITAGHMATIAGLKTGIAGHVLDREGRPIGGLYAAGNDMSNVFGGACPGGGITLGPGMTFGYLTALHLAGVLRDEETSDGVGQPPQPEHRVAFDAA